MIYYLAAGLWGVLLAFAAQAVRQNYGTIKSKLHLGAALAAPKAQNTLFLVLAIVSMLPLALLSGLRNDVGTDYFYTYVPAFEDIANGMPINNSYVEPGYWLLNKLIQVLGGNIVWLFVITSFVIVGFFGAGIYRLSELPWYSVALFLLTETYFISMNCVRQHMGLAIIFFGFAFIRKPCFWKYAICVVVAALFHMSSLMFLPLYFSIYIKWKPIVPLVVLTVASALNPVLKQVLEWLVSFTPYSNYLGSEFISSERFYPERLILNLLVVLLAVYYYHKNGNDEKPLYRFFFYCELLLVFLLMNHNIIPQTSRLCWSLEAVHILFLPMLARSEENKALRITIFAALALLWGQLCYSEIFIKGYHEVYNYQSVFSSSVAG